MKKKITYFRNAPKIVSHSNPAAYRLACYKSDGDNPIGDLTEKVKEFNEQNKQLIKEAGEAKAEVTRITKEYEEKVTGLNKTLTDQGATVKQLQDTVLELQAKTGHIAKGIGNSDLVLVDDLIAKALEDKPVQEILKDCRLNVPWKTKSWANALWKTEKAKAVGTMTLSTNVTGASIVGVPTISPEIATRGYDETHFRDLFPTLDSATGTFVFYRANTPTGEGSILDVNSGATKSQVDKDLTMIVVNAKYKAGYCDIAKDMLTDIPALQSYLNEELTNDYLDRETYDMLGNLVSSATGPTPGTGSNVIEKLIYVLAGLRQKKYRPNFILVRPAKWADILVTKPADYNTPNSVVITPQGTVAIVGLPVYTTSSNGMDDSHALVGDSRKARIMQVTGEGLKMELFQQHDKAVYENLVTMRVEARVAPIIFRLDAFSYPAI